LASYNIMSMRMCLKNCIVKKINYFDFCFYLFYEQKALDFTLKVVGGDISTLPGVSEAIEVQENYFERQFCYSFDFIWSNVL
jgi:hypothetical protein